MILYAKFYLKEEIVLPTYQDNPIVQKNRWLILIAVASFTFMSTLDGSIVNIALPVISKDLNIPMNQVEWVVSIYLMTACACLLVFGKLGDSIGKIKVFRLGMIIFTLGSFLCGFNHSLGLLLVARIIQAIGASMTMATNTGIITEVFPMSERGRALGSIGAFVSLGSIAGPGIGGVILGQLPWGYIFWINIPIGILTFFLGTKVLPKDIHRSGHPIDTKGFGLFALFIITLFGGIFIGQEIGFTRILPIILFLAAILSFISFILVEKRVKLPLITFGIFKNQTFSLSLLCATLIFASNFFINVIVPFYLQRTLNLKPSVAGLLMMVFPVVMVVASPLSGLLTDKFGPKYLVISGLTILSITQICYMFLDIHTPIFVYAVITAFVGLGNSLFQSPNNTMVMSSVTRENLGLAGSLNSFARNFGMVVGISLATTILYQAMSLKAGYKVTTYLNQHPEFFIYGMKIAFFGSFLLCFSSLIISIYRLRKI